MILRLYDEVDYEGRILVDEVNIKEWVPTKLRRQIMLVEQNPLLFNLSVTDNITLGMPGFTKEQVEHAAQVAHAHDFITKLPKGYDTHVGNGGKELASLFLFFYFTI
jgi:ATP-binding cassette, subfamily B, bacterial